MSQKLALKVLFDGVDKLTKPLKAISGGSNEAAKALKATRDQLKVLNDEQSKISGFNKTLESARQATSAYREQKEALAEVSKKLEGARFAQSAMVASVKQARAEHRVLMQAFAKNQEIPGLTGKLMLAQERLKSLEGQYSRAQNATRRMKLEVSEASRELDQARARKNSYTEALRRTSQALKDAGLNTKNLGDRSEELATKVANVNKTLEAQKQKIEHITAARSRLGKSLELKNRAAGAGIAVGAVGAAAAAPVLATARSFAIAEDAATQLKVSMMGANGEVGAQYQQISALATNLGNRLPGTTADYQNMMTMLVRQGMSAKTILGGLGEATAYLGVQLKMPMDAAAEFASKLQDATRTSEGEMMGLMDTIQRTYYLGVDSDNMLQGFSKLSPLLDVVKRKGLEFTNMMAPLLVMADQAGMKGEAAGNAYRKVFQYALDTKKLGKANALLDGKGIKLDFSDGKGEFGGLDKMFQQLEKLKGLNTQTRLAVIKQMFGDDAETLQAVALMVEKGAAGYGEIAGKMQAQASLQTRVNEQLGTLSALWEAASGTFTNAMVAFGEAISPELKAITTWLGETADGIRAWAAENPRLAGGILKVVGVVAIAATAVGGLLLAFSAILGPFAVFRYAIGWVAANGLGFVAVLKGVGTAIGFIGRMLLMNPIGFAITAIATAAYFIYTYWEPIKAFFSGIWSEIKTAFSGGIGSIAALIINWSPLGLFYQAFSSVLGWFGIELPGKFTEFGSMLIDGLVNGISKAFPNLSAKIGEIADGTVKWFKERLGIHSPSRVFAELGGFTMQGFEQGITGGQDGPLNAVSGMARQLAALGAGITLGGAAMAGGMPLDTRPPLTAGGGQGGGGGIVIQQLVIHGAPGQGVDNIQRQVEQALENIMARQAVRRRASLRDRD